jgi:hypothetical protein
LDQADPPALKARRQVDPIRLTIGRLGLDARPVSR